MLFYRFPVSLFFFFELGRGWLAVECLIEVVQEGVVRESKVFIYMTITLVHTHKMHVYAHKWHTRKHTQPQKGCYKLPGGEAAKNKDQEVQGLFQKRPK